MKIPTIGPENVRQVTSESSEREVEPSRIQGVGDSIATIAGAAQDASMQLYQAGKARDKLRAENIADVAQSKTLADIDADTDFSLKKTEERKKQLEKSDLDAAKHIHNEVDRNNFLLQRQAKRNVLGVSIDHQQNLRLANDLKAQVEIKKLTGGNLYATAAVGPVGDAQRKIAADDLDSTLNEGLKAGLYGSAAEMDMAKVKVIQEWENKRVGYDIDNNADLALTNLKLASKGEGPYAGRLSELQQQDAVERAEKRQKFNFEKEAFLEKQKKAEYTQGKHSTLLNLSTRMAAKDPTVVADIKRAVEAGQMTTEMSYWMQLAPLNDKELNKSLSWSADSAGNLVAPTGGANMLIDAMKQLGSSDVAGRTALLETSLKNLADPEANYKMSDHMFLLHTMQGIDADPKNALWGKVISSVGYIAQDRKPSAADIGPRALETFKSTWDGKGDPHPVASAAIQEAVKEKYPDIKSWEVGKEYSSPSGRKFKYLGINETTGEPEVEASGK